MNVFTWYGPVPTASALVKVTGSFSFSQMCLGTISIVAILENSSTAGLANSMTTWLPCAVTDSSTGPTPIRSSAGFFLIIS